MYELVLLRRLLIILKDVAWLNLNQRRILKYFWGLLLMIYLQILSSYWVKETIFTVAELSLFHVFYNYFERAMVVLEFITLINAINLFIQIVIVKFFFLSIFVKIVIEFLRILIKITLVILILVFIIVVHFDLQELKQTVRDFQSSTYLFTLKFYRRSLRPTLEYSFFVFANILIIALFVFNSNLFKGQFLLFSKILPSIRDSLHYLSNCQKREPLADDFPEFLAEVDVC